uniref:KH domain-containing protein n=1 Tax=Panagrellus redivivus TaxID=6233 RepID=A0A7E4V605_PANRE
MEIQEIYFNACFGKRRNFYHASQESNRVITAVGQMEARMTEQKTEHYRRRRERSGATATTEPEDVVIPNIVTLALETQSYDFCDIISMNTTWCNLDTDNVYNIEKDLDVQFQFADHSITHESSIDIRHRVTISGSLRNVLMAAERFKTVIPINIAISLENLPPSVTLDKVVAKLQEWKDSDCSKPFSNVEIMLFMPKVHGPIVNDFTINEDGVLKFIGSKGTQTSPCIRVRGRASSRDDIANAVKAVYTLVFEQPAENNFKAITCYNLTDRVDEWLQRRPINEMAQFLADMNDVSLTFPKRPTNGFISTVPWMIISKNVEGVVDAAAQIYDLLPCSIKVFNVAKCLVDPAFTSSIDALHSPVCTALDQSDGVGVVARVAPLHYDLDFIAPLGNLRGIVASIQKIVLKGFSLSEPIPPPDEENAVGEYYREIFPGISDEVAFPRAISCLDFHTDVPWHTVSPPLIRFIPFNQITRILFERDEFETNWTSEVGDDDVFLPSNQSSSIDVQVRLCPLHGHPLITQYEQVSHHVTPRKALAQCVDATVKFWLRGSTPCGFGAKDPNGNENKVHVPVETLFTSIQPSLKSKSRRKAERVKQTVLCSKAIHASDLESKLVFEASPLTPTSKRDTQNCPTPIDQREVPTTAYIAKFILERVPRACMSYNFYQYHMLTLFHGDMAAKGALDNYPFCNKAMTFPPGKPMTESEIVQVLGVDFDGDDAS